MNKLVDDFIYFIQFVEPRSEATVSSYKHDVIQYIKYLEDEEIETIEDVSYTDVMTYLNTLNVVYKPATISRKVTAIKQFHNYLLRYNRLNFDVTSHVANRSRKTALPKAISVDEVRKLLSFKSEDSHDFMDLAIILILFRCGLRVSECINLEFSQIYQEERWLRIVGKGNKERMVPISEDAFDALQYYIQVIRPTYASQNTNKVFINKKGHQVTRQYVHKMVKLRGEQAGLKHPISPHTLRHTLATSLLNEDVDLRAIQEILGHADIATTQIYTHVNKDKMKAEYDQFLIDPNKRKKDK